jgi:serine/threonine protein kinase
MLVRHPFNFNMLSPGESRELLAYFRAHPEQIFFPEGDQPPFSVSDPADASQSIQKIYHFPTSILHRKSQRWSDQEGYLLITKELGSGNYGHVYAIDAALVSQKDDSLHYKTCKWVVKKTTGELNPQENPLLTALAENRLARFADYLGVKGFFVLDDHFHAVDLNAVPKVNGSTFLLLRRFQGEEFFKPLQRDYDNKIQPLLFSMDLRLDIVDKICWSYALQIYRNRLVHRDLKPENAITQITADKMETFYWIDPGLGKEESFNDIGWKTGSPHYMSPEAGGRLGMTIATDIFSLGKILILLFRGWQEDNSAAAISSNHALMQHIFRHITDSSPYELAKIKIILQEITTFDPALRPSLEDVMRSFAYIRSERQIAKIADPVQQQAARDAFDQALKNLRPFNDSIYDRELRKTNSHTPFKFKIFLEIFYHQLLPVMDAPQVIEQFIAGLHSDLFNACKTKYELEQTLSAFYRSYTDNLKCFLRLKSSLLPLLETNPPGELLDLHAAMEKTVQKRLNATLFDDCVLLNAKLQKQYTKFAPIAHKWKSVNAFTNHPFFKPAVVLPPASQPVAVSTPPVIFSIK